MPKLNASDPGLHVEEGLLLDGIALRAGHVAPGREQRAAAVEADLADTGGAVGNRARVAAGEAAHPRAVVSLVQRRVAGRVRAARASASVAI